MKPTAPFPDHRCLACGCPDRDKPMAFRGTDWCCELHRKQLVADGLIEDTVVEPRR